MEILRQIGGGSYGEIWMARSVTDTLRAVKVVYRGDFDDAKTFEREFEGILKYEPLASGHPGLVDLLHVGRGRNGEEEFYYYVMELGDDVERGSAIHPADYEPRTLRSDMLRSGKRPLAVGFCAEAGAQLAGALAHLHENGVAHRDMKPSNVIFVKGKACLADIGLVATRDQRTFVGTEGFVPPEGPGSAGADVYALGKVIYEMATGKDRLDFPELPDDPIEKKELKRWLALNKIVCETCDPRIKKRRYTEAAELERVLRLIASAKRLKKKRPPVGLMVSSGVVVLGLLAPSLIPTPSLEIAATPREVMVPTVSFVTVTSTPEGAEVYDGDGVLLGPTPFGPKEYPIGMKVTYQLRYPGYEMKEVEKVLDQADEILVVNLNRYPPEPGVEWQDFLGQRYFPEPKGHLSAYLVGPVEFRSSPAAANKNWHGVEVRENGVRRRVAFVTEQAGEDFVRWLARESEVDGVKGSEYRFAAEFEDGGSYEGVPEEFSEKGLQPFRVRVDPILPGRLVFVTEPLGAFVYLDDVYQGSTPLEGLEILPGKVRLRAELEGYEDFSAELTMIEGQTLVIDSVALSPSEGMPWQIPDWKNSLGMEFVKLNKDLLVARWETRVGDYQQFTKATRRAVPAATEFAQTRAHPVVNITREDALAFCKWLTAKERKAGKIRESNEYRLPTDAEWSLMAEEEVEPGLTPRQRASMEREGFPWGDEFPPLEKVANIAGQEGAALTKTEMLVEGYNDGFSRTAPVGQFPPNELGIHDLGGNVREWVSDFYTTEEDGYGTTRGGSWEDYREEHLRTGARRLVLETGDGYGFRVVLAKIKRLEENDAEPELEDENG